LEKKSLKDENGRWVECGVFFMSLIVEGRGAWVIFFHFFIFMFVISWDLLLFKKGGGGGRGGGKWGVGLFY